MPEIRYWTRAQAQAWKDARDAARRLEPKNHRLLIERVPLPASLAEPMLRALLRDRPPADALPVTYLCEHHACRCARADELADAYDRTGEVRYLFEAIAAHERLVRCRLAQ
jgi:hypothetical protein